MRHGSKLANELRLSSSTWFTSKFLQHRQPYRTIELAACVKATWSSDGPVLLHRGLGQHADELALAATAVSNGQKESDVLYVSGTAGVEIVDNQQKQFPASI
jgi:hypothetical protein